MLVMPMLIKDQEVADTRQEYKMSELGCNITTEDAYLGRGL